jgi:hypothetical protein
MILSRVSPATQRGFTPSNATLSFFDKDEQLTKIMTNKATEKQESIRFANDYLLSIDGVVHINLFDDSVKSRSMMPILAFLF